MNQKTKTGRNLLVSIILVLLAVLALAIVNLAVKTFSPEARAARQEAMKTEEVVYAVNTTTAVKGPIADFFRTNGEVEAISSVDTYADTAGILAHLYAGLGDYVRAGQVIAEVDPSRPGLNYTLSPVKARVSGTITNLSLDVGDAVSPQVPVATIGDLNRLQVVAAIPERYINRIYVGMPAEVSLEAWPGKVIPLTVSQINPVVDTASRTMEINLAIPAGNEMAKAGMYAGITLTTDQKEDVVKIPSDTILRRLGETFVYVIEGNVAQRRAVVPGITFGDVVEIIDGLEAGEKIAYQGQTLLEDGVTVRVIRDVQVIN